MLVEVVVGCVTFLGKLEESLHRSSGTWNDLLHLVNEILLSAGHRDIQMPPASCRPDTAEQVGDQDPLRVQFVFLFKQLAGKSPLGR